MAHTARAFVVRAPLRAHRSRRSYILFFHTLLNVSVARTCVTRFYRAARQERASLHPRGVWQHINIS